jgi:hypothetical protein
MAATTFVVMASSANGKFRSAMLAVPMTWMREVNVQRHRHPHDTLVLLRALPSRRH